MVQPSQSVPLELALRLLIPDPMLGERVQFSLGELPDELPIELPLPEQSQVIASLQQEQAVFTILIRAPQPSLLTQSWYSNRLRALDWLQWQESEERINMNFHIFGDPTPGQRNTPISSLSFCHRPQLLTLTLQFRPATNNSTYVKLKLSDDNVLPSPYQEEWERNMLNWLPIPQLVAPSGTRFLQGRRLSGSNKALKSEARIQTSFSSDLLLSHYNTQLAQSGWTQQAGEEQDPLRWSIWTLQDQRNQIWQLLLSLVADNNHADQYKFFLWVLNLNAFDRVIPPVSAPPIPSTEWIPEDILRHLISEDYFPDIETQQLWVGQLPPKLPASLEFPEQTQLLGSLSEKGSNIELFLTVSLPLNQIYEHLTEQLFKLGLREFSSLSDYENLGFTLSRKRRWEQTTFIHPRDETECCLTFNAIALHHTDVKVTWLLPFKEADNLSVENAPSTSQEPWDQALLPIVVLPEQIDNLPIEDAPSTPQNPWGETPLLMLSVPKQTEVISRELEYTNENYTVTVYIITSLSTAVLIAHYQTEMQRAGWQQQTTSQNENCYLSLWSFTTEQGRLWQGILNLLARPEKQDQYTGYLEIRPSSN